MLIGRGGPRVDIAVEPLMDVNIVGQSVLYMASLPLEAIVLETDAPDIPPYWLNGARNEPVELAAMARTLAELRGVSVDEVAAATSANARAVLNRLPPVETIAHEATQRRR